jgi:prefoldin subunit 5
LNLEIKAVRERADERSDKLQIEVRQLKEMIDNKNHEIQSLSQQKEQYIREVRLLEEKNRNKGNIE